MRLMSSPWEGQGKVGLFVEHSQAMGDGVAAAGFVDDFYNDASAPNFPHPECGGARLWRRRGS